MDKVGAYEAKTHLPKLLERAAKGHRITITQYGVPMAILGPYDPERSVEIADVIRQLYEFRETNSLSGLTILAVQGSSEALELGATQQSDLPVRLGLSNTWH